MRLLDTYTGHFVERDPKDTEYAILSHTWDNINGEQTYKELRRIQRQYATPESQFSRSHSRNSHHPFEPLSRAHHKSPVIRPMSSQPPPDPLAITSFLTPSNPAPARVHWETGVQATSQPPVDPPPTGDPPQDEKGVSLSDTMRKHLETHPKRHGFLHYRGLQHGSSAARPIPPPSQVNLDPAVLAPSSGPVFPHLPTDTDPSPSIVYSSESESDGPYSTDPSSMFPNGSQPRPSPRFIWDDPRLSPKIRDACAVARANGFQYIWIDSCCIDKSSSSELSEGINSMYIWYARATVCYAYLADVPAEEAPRAQRSRCFRQSRWFTRGWTLQELIAPADVIFLSGDWNVIGSKHALVDLVESVTGISYGAQLHLEPLDKVSVAQRLSWAAMRQTTRVEDRAYSLLGIFDINMPTLYGEGEGAFRRLQEEIMRRIPDQSIFAWGRLYSSPRNLSEPGATGTTMEYRTHDHDSSLLANDPSAFRDSGSIRVTSLSIGSIPGSQVFPHLDHEVEYTFSPYGIRTQFLIIPLSMAFPSSSIRYCEPHAEHWERYLVILGCEHKDRPGHLLGRVCYIPPSTSGAKLLHPGYVSFYPRLPRGGDKMSCDLFPLSPETIRRCLPHISEGPFQTAYISHADRTAVPAPNARLRPHKTIRLVLVKETSDALLARGYSASLRSGRKNGRPTHRLSLANGRAQTTVIVDFLHTLVDGGEQFTIDAQVKTSRPHPDGHPAGGAQADPTTLSWTDFIEWRTRLGHESVKLRVGDTRELALDLDLEFAGLGVYVLHVNVLSDVVTGSQAVPSSGPAAPGEDRQLFRAGEEGEVENAEVDGKGRWARHIPRAFLRQLGHLLNAGLKRRRKD